MKTGRARSKQPPPKEPVSPEPTPAAAPPSEPVEQPRELLPTAPPSPTLAPGIQAPQPTRSGPSRLILVAFIAIIVIIGIMIIVTLLGGKTDEWVAVTRASGDYTTALTVFGPQVSIQEAWEGDCINNPNGLVQTGTCILKDSNTYHDNVVDDYEEYAYNIYFEETWSQTYQAQGTEFVVSVLGKDDWWEENLHYTRVEELDRQSCQYTSFTIWVDDTADSTQESEVFLSECEVWDHITVEERIYDQAMWCQCGITSLVQLGVQSSTGSGGIIQWPQVVLPEGGRTEQAFSGKVTFLGDDYKYSVTTDDLNQYQDFLTSQYYIGIRKGKPVRISKNPN